METRPKILYVVKRFSGGIFTYLVELSNSLIKNYDIVIVYATNSDTPNNFRSYFDEQVRLVRMESLSENASPLLSSKAELKEIVKKEQPNIIHFHGHGAGKVGRKALNNISIPMYYTPHGYVYLTQDHNLLSRNLQRREEGQLAKTNCMTIACSRGEYAETLSLTSNCTYINNGIDLKELDAITAQPKTSDKMIVCTTGLINEQKNPGLFNEIASAMPQIQFVWIGDGELKYKLTASNIEVTGWLERKEALARVKQADVFILTSLWEGLPISLLEAMYFEKLCIVTNVVGSRDVIHNGENGYVCDNAAMFVNVINHCKDESMNEVLQNAKEDIIENYNVQTMAKQYDMIYKKALKQG